MPRTPLEKLDIFQNENQPKAFYFRHPEILGARPKIDPEAWDARYADLQGILGKVLDEEVPGRNKVLPLFVEFKKRHPQQLVMLHFNGIARDPSFETQGFFAGHWLYFQGSKVHSSLNAQEDESILQVDQVSLFQTNIGRFKKHADDIGICVLGSDGRPDWTVSEQVQLLEVLPGQKSIRVKRGTHGTERRNWKAGQCYAAAHVSNGPWGENSPLLWQYNFSSRCPKNAHGQNCSDALVSDLQSRFASGGALESFDGVEFDGTVGDLRWPAFPMRAADCDADGKPDDGFSGTENHYGEGVDYFFEKLRDALGKERLIACDGVYVRPIQARSNKRWNGMESEGWPVRTDPNFDEWSSGWNRHAFARQVAIAPKMNYINHKFTVRGKDFTLSSAKDFPMNSHRLVMAAAVLNDCIFASSFLPPADSETVNDYWDEIVGGQRKQVGWLGKPIEPVRYLADEGAENIFPKMVKQSGGLSQLLGNSIEPIASIADSFKVVGNNGKDILLRFPKIATQGSDLVVTFECRRTQAQARLPQRVVADCGPNVRLELDPMSPSGLQSWVTDDWFSTRFYFRGLEAKQVDVAIRFEGLGPVEVRNVGIRTASESLVRRYENGLILANPSRHSISVDLAKLYPESRWQRLHGSADQDPKTNDGSLAQGRLEIAAQDGLFLEAAR